MAIPEFGRLAMRVEGDWWVAYFANPNTMDRALQIGRVHMSVAGIHKDETLEYFKGVVSKMVKTAAGHDLVWPNAPRTAPEHEKVGRS